MERKPFVVLMAEDDENDIIATKRAWEKCKISNPLYIVNNGEECLDYLHHRGKYSDPSSSPDPGILLLDIRMPRMDGLTTLEHIRKDKKLRMLPVVILTTSAEESDRMQSYNIGANAFIIKPVGFSNFAQALEKINLFWELVELPFEGVR